MTTEQWKNIMGYTGIYQVSNMGRIKSLARKRSRGIGNLKEKFLKTAPGGRGYPLVRLEKEGTSRTFSIHRLVALTFLGQPLDTTLTEVHHKNTNRKDARLENLEWTTPHSNCDAKCLKYGMGKYNQRDNPIEYII